MNRTTTRFSLLGLAGLLLAASLPAAGDTHWPTWRGPGAIGIGDGETLPDRWDPEGGNRWKVEIPGTSTSTPVVWGEQIFLTTQIGRSPIARRGEDAVGPEADDQLTFVVMSLDRGTGDVLWTREIPSEGTLPATHLKHNLASPSPATDGKVVAVWFATGQALAFDLQGKELWRRNLAEEYGSFEIRWAHGSSPTLHDGRVYFLCEHQTAYLLALDAATGDNVWRVDRGEAGRSYTTPLLIETGGGPQLVVNASRRIDAYDPDTGALLWRAGQPIRVPVSTPVFDDGVLYTSRGYRSGPYMAIRVGDEREGGDITEANTLWRVGTGAPYVSSLLHYRGLVYMATENGVVSAVDAATGETVWRERLGGNFSASPVGADGKVYLANEEGEFFVLEASREFRVISQTSLPEGIKASPVISGDHILMRSARYLYSF